MIPNPSGGIWISEKTGLLATMSLVCTCIQWTKSPYLLWLIVKEKKSIDCHTSRNPRIWGISKTRRFPKANLINKAKNSTWHLLPEMLSKLRNSPTLQRRSESAGSQCVTKHLGIVIKTNEKKLESWNQATRWTNKTSLKFQGRIEMRPKNSYLSSILKWSTWRNHRGPCPDQNKTKIWHPRRALKIRPKYRAIRMWMNGWMTQKSLLNIVLCLNLSWNWSRTNLHTSRSTPILHFKWLTAKCSRALSGRVCTKTLPFNHNWSKLIFMDLIRIIPPFYLITLNMGIPTLWGILSSLPNHEGKDSEFVWMAN